MPSWGPAGAAEPRTTARLLLQALFTAEDPVELVVSRLAIGLFDPFLDLVAVKTESVVILLAVPEEQICII